MMPLQPRRDNLNDLEALERIDVLPVTSPQSMHPFFAEQPNSLLHYWRILRKRKWVVLASFAIVFALSVLATMNATRLYQATAKVAIFPENPNVLGFKDMENSSPDYEYEATLETQVAILRSNALALKVIDAMRLYQDPRFTVVKQVPPESSLEPSSMQPDPAQAAGLRGAFHGGLIIQLVPSSRLIQVSYIHPNPPFATEITNTLVKTFIEENFRTKYTSVTQTSEWLSRELADLQ